MSNPYDTHGAQHAQHAQHTQDAQCTQRTQNAQSAPHAGAAPAAAGGARAQSDGEPAPVAGRGPLVLGDDDVRARLDPATAVDAVRHALLEHHAGRLHAPARVSADVGAGSLVFTVGRLGGDQLHGFRVYDTRHAAEQLVALWNSDTGALDTVVHGDELGPRRTGAIGAVAVDLAARPDATRLGLIGTGAQAWTQLWALSAVRDLGEVAVYGRRADRAERFAARVRDELGFAARPVPTAREAVSGQDIVIVATSSTTPVLDAAWVEPGTHLTTLGPKTRAGHEVPPDLGDRADVLLTDSLAQAAGTPNGHVFDHERMVELGSVLAGAVPGRTAEEQVTVFCSVGLAGTEVAVAGAMLR